MPETTETAPVAAESKATQRWQKAIRPWMQYVVTGVIIFFLLVSGWQIYYLHQRIASAPELKLDFVASGSLAAEQEQWRNLARLEAHVIQQRYHQANVILMSRIWTTYLGFVTGMILAVVGAAFILGKLREQSSEISGKTELWQISIASTSPGLMMVVLGTALMLTTILTHHQIGVHDVPTYVGAVNRAPTAAITTVPAPADISDALKNLEERRATDADSLLKQ